MWHCKHYTGRGVMKYYASGADLAKDMGIPVQTLIDTHQGHFDAAKKQEKCTHPPLKVDRMRHGPIKPNNGSNMVRFGSADLWASALGVKRVQRSDPPWSRGRPRPTEGPKLAKFETLPPIYF